MSDRTVSLTLTARDQITRTFETIGREGDELAREMVRSMQQIERGTEQTTRELQQFERETRNAERSSASFNQRMAAAGVALTALSGVLSDASRASEESAQIQRQLEQAIANTGEAYSAYASQIDEVSARAVQLGVDDEKASQAIQALTEITGDAGVALDKMALVMDLAAAKGIDLVTAAELVGRAHEGNTAMLARYGIVVDNTASSEQILGQIHDQVRGQAEAHATTTDRLRVQFGNLQEAAGAALGELAPYVALLPGLSSGFSLAGAALGGLSTALGPAGLVLAAGAAAFAVYKLTQSEDENAEIARAMRTATEDLTGTLRQLTAAGNPLGETGRMWSDILASAIAGMGDLATAEAEVERTTRALDEAQRDLAGTEGQERAQIETRIKNLEVQQTRAEETVRAIKDQADAQEALNRILVNTGTGADLALDELGKLFARFAETRDVDQLIAGLIEVSRHLGDYDRQANEAAEANKKLASSITEIDRATPSLVAHLLGLIDTTTRLGTQTELSRDGWDALMASINRRGFDDAAGGVARLDPVLQKMTEETRDLRAEMDAFGGVRAFAIEAAVRGLTGGIVEMAGAAESASASLGVMFGPLSGSGIEASLRGLVPSMAELAAAADPVESAFDRVARGSSSAAVQLAAFKEVQDGIIASQQPFTHQLSEYNTQLGYLNDAEELLNERRAAGIELTKEQEDFLSRVDAAQERLTGGTEDATLALGDQALKYAENMKAGDRMNDSLAGVEKTSGDLTDAIRDLITALADVPEDVETDVKADTAQAETNVAGYKTHLGELNGMTAYTNVVLNGVDSAIDRAVTLGRVLNGLDGRVVTSTTNFVERHLSDLYQHGGMVGFQHGGMPGWPDLPGAQHGRAGNRGWFMAGEAGPEPIYAPGAYVVPNAAAQANGMIDRGRKGGGDIIIQHMTIVANNPREFGRQLAQHRRMELR